MGWIKNTWRGFKGWLGRVWRATTASPAAVGLSLAAFVGGIALGFPFADNAYDRVWVDPHFCSSCHIHDYADEAYFRSQHAGVTTCHDCHQVPLIHYPGNVYGVLFKDYSDPENAIKRPHVKNVLCANCHVEGYESHLTGPMTDEMRARVVKINDSPLHKVHMLAEVRVPPPAKGGPHGADPEAVTAAAQQEWAEHGAEETTAIACMDCHGSPYNRAHQFLPTRAACLQCHTSIDKSGGRLSTLKCQECHFAGFTGRPGNPEAAEQDGH